MIFDKDKRFVKLLQNQSLEAWYLLFLIFAWKKLWKNFGKTFGQSNIFVISKRQSSLSNKFYDKNQTLQAEAISDIFRIDLSDWLILYQFFIVINYVYD